jgi:hypothetical protein
MSSLALTMSNSGWYKCLPLLFTLVLFYICGAIFPLVTYFLKCVGLYVKTTKIAEITGGKIDFELRIRVLNLWAIPDCSNPAEEGAIHMIFLDGEVCLAFCFLTFMYCLRFILCFLCVCFVCLAWKNSCDHS